MTRTRFSASEPEVSYLCGGWIKQELTLRSLQKFIYFGLLLSFDRDDTALLLVRRLLELVC